VKIPVIEFLPLNWIYRSISINTVLYISLTVVCGYKGNLLTIRQALICE